MSSNNISQLFNIKHPIVQAGMVWCSGWQLASAVSNQGGLGVIGAGSMYPEVLKEHIIKCKKATNLPFAVNVPLLYPDIDKLIDIIISEKVKIVFTSAGNPEIWTGKLKENGIVVVHVVSNSTFAKKAESAGVDAVVAEGFEAGGHNGREETTIFSLIPLVKKAVSIPVIAAGGIATGRGVLAAIALGADGVQIGSRFIVTKESSANIDFKNRLLATKEGDTKLMMKNLMPVRLLKNPFYDKIQEAEDNGKSNEEILAILGKGRAKKGMFEGDLIEGELEVGQVAALFEEIQTVEEVMKELVGGYNSAKEELDVL